MRKLLRQELLTINYSSRYPNLSVAPLLCKWRSEAPRALFGFSRSFCTTVLLTVTTDPKRKRKSRLEKGDSLDIGRRLPRIYILLLRALEADYRSSRPLLARFFLPARRRFATLPRFDCYLREEGEGSRFQRFFLLQPTSNTSTTRKDIALSRLPVNKHRSITN